MGFRDAQLPLMKWEVIVLIRFHYVFLNVDVLLTMVALSGCTDHPPSVGNEQAVRWIARERCIYWFTSTLRHLSFGFVMPVQLRTRSVRTDF